MPLNVYQVPNDEMDLTPPNERQVRSDVRVLRAIRNILAFHRPSPVGMGQWPYDIADSLSDAVNEGYNLGIEIPANFTVHSYVLELFFGESSKSEPAYSEKHEELARKTFTNILEKPKYTRWKDITIARIRILFCYYLYLERSTLQNMLGIRTKPNVRLVDAYARVSGQKDPCHLEFPEFVGLYYKQSEVSNDSLDWCLITASPWDYLFSIIFVTDILENDRIESNVVALSPKEGANHRVLHGVIDTRAPRELPVSITDTRPIFDFSVYEDEEAAIYKALVTFPNHDDRIRIGFHQQGANGDDFIIPAGRDWHLSRLTPPHKARHVRMSSKLNRIHTEIGF